MSAASLLERLEALAGEEREALRTADADVVLALAGEKERLLEGLRACDAHGLLEARPRLVRVQSLLRHNGVLLARARDCIRDARTALGAPSQSSTGRLVSTRL